jgi:hypothetical protein
MDGYTANADFAPASALFVEAAVALSYVVKVRPGHDRQSCGRCWRGQAEPVLIKEI